MAQVLFASGKQQGFNNLASKDQNTLYFISDTGRIYKGNDLIADKSISNVVFSTTVPDAATAEAGILYVVTTADGIGIYAKNSEAGGVLEQVGGGEVTTDDIADGSITFDKLATDTVVTVIGDTPTDSTIPTAKAVSDAIKAAVDGINTDYADVITGVTSTAATAEGETGTVLTFTRKSGTNPIEVKIGDLFLSAASYDSDTHILTLTVGTGESASNVTVDLEALIPQAVSFSDIEVGSAAAFTVELGDGGTLGGYKTGDTISQDATLENVVKKLLMKQVPPTYTPPTVSIANNGGTAAGNVEIGTSVTPKLRATFNKNDAGALTTIVFTKNGTNTSTTSSTSPADYTEAAFQLTNTTSYTAKATYAEGAIKNDNLGDPYPTGHIAAGTKTSSTFTYTPYRKGFYGAVSSKSGTIDASFVRGLTSSTTSAPSNGNTWTINIPVGTLRVAFAYPATLQDVTSVTDAATKYDVKTAFSKTLVDVPGAANYSAISYKVYVTDFADPTTEANSYAVKI